MREEIEREVGVLYTGDGARFVRVHEVGKLDRVADEEDRQVVADQIPVAFLRVELGRETARVARLFRRAPVIHHGGKTHEHRRAGAGLEYGRLAQRGDIGVGLEHTERTGAACMHDALRNALAIEALQLFDQARILQQGRAIGAGRLRILVVPNGDAGVAGEMNVLGLTNANAERQHEQEG